MSTEPSILVMLGIAVAGLVLGMVSCVLRVVRIFSTNKKDANLRLWQQGVERQLGRLEGTIEANEKKGNEK